MLALKPKDHNFMIKADKVKTFSCYTYQNALNAYVKLKMFYFSNTNNLKVKEELKMNI